MSTYPPRTGVIFVIEGPKIVRDRDRYAHKYRAKLRMTPSVGRAFLTPFRDRGAVVPTPGGTCAFFIERFVGDYGNVARRRRRRIRERNVYVQHATISQRHAATRLPNVYGRDIKERYCICAACTVLAPTLNRNGRWLQNAVRYARFEKDFPNGRRGGEVSLKPVSFLSRDTRTRTHIVIASRRQQIDGSIYHLTVSLRFIRLAEFPENRPTIIITHTHI